MKDFIKNKSGSVLGYLVCIVFGVIICFNPGEVLTTICRIAGLVILICGAYYLILGVKNENAAARSFQFIIGIVLAIAGIWIALRPGTFLKLIPIFVGIVMVYHGVMEIYTSMKSRKSNSKWGVGLITAIISLLLGLYLIFRAFKALEIGMVILGLVLIYDGISGLWLVIRTSGRKSG